MRSVAAFTLPIVLAGVARASSQWERGFGPENTADWFKERGLSLPEVAPAITRVKEGQSYVVKLECLGCPFDVHPWQGAKEESSLLLNFTIDASNSLESTLLLNGAAVAPDLSLPLPITAIQTPANVTTYRMSKLVSEPVLNRPFAMISIYGNFELQYEHTLLATQEPTEEWVQFDVTGAYVRAEAHALSAKLDKEGQKLVQILLKQSISEGSQTLSIKDIQVVERKDRVQPLKMKCGKLAMLQTEYNPLEWDSYGQFGTWSRAWHIFLSASAQFMLREGPIILIAVALFSAARFAFSHARNRPAAQVEDDAEAALLGPDYDDAPPEYDGEEKEEKEVER